MTSVDDDTGIASAVAPRPSVFVPPTPLAPADTPTTDQDVQTTPAARPDNFDDTSGALIVVDPGDVLTP